MSTLPPITDVFFVFNETMRCLVDRYFLPSLPSSFKPNGLFLDLWSSGNFHQDNFEEILRAKTRCIIEILSNGPQGEIFVWCDIDLVFLADPAEDLHRWMKGRNLSYQREWEHDDHEANTGLQVIRRNTRTLEFYREVLRNQEYRQPASDQHWVNQLRRSPESPPWTLLPSTYSSSSNGGVHPDSILYHANNTVSDSLAQKKEALDRAIAAASARKTTGLK